jgi:hypothetical protein
LNFFFEIFTIFKKTRSVAEHSASYYKINSVNQTKSLVNTVCWKNSARILKAR